MPEPWARWRGGLLGPVRGWEAAVAVILLGALALSRMNAVSFHVDEATWLKQSQLLELYLTGRWDDPVWQPRRVLYLNPLLHVYTIGVGRRLGGYTPEELPDRWDYDADAATNEAAGRVPPADLLWWARLPMMILLAGIGGGGFLLCSHLGGRVAAYAFLGLLAAQSYVLDTLGRAMSEAPLLAGIMLAGFCLWRAIQSWEADAHSGLGRPSRRTWAWFAVTGVACGIAWTAKLTGLAALLGAFLISAVAMLRPGRGMPWTKRASTLGLVALLMTAGAAALFLAHDPFLWPDPLGRIGTMFTLRTEEMAIQAQRYPKTAIIGLRARVSFLSRVLLRELAPFRFPWAHPLNLALGMAGALISTIPALRWAWGQGEQGDPMAAIFWVVGLGMALPPLASPLNWRRYFFFPAFFLLLLVAVGLGGIVRWFVTLSANRAPSLS